MKGRIYDLLLERVRLTLQGGRHDEFSIHPLYYVAPDGTFSIVTLLSPTMTMLSLAPAVRCVACG